MSGPLALLWGLSCFAFGWLAHAWAHRRPQADPSIDLRATLGTPKADIDRLIAMSKVTIKEAHDSVFEEQRRRVKKRQVLR